MFHRVKSEEPETAKEDASQNTKQDAAQADISADTDETSDEAESTTLDIEIEETPKATSSNSQEKDKQTMTDQDKTTSEQEDSAPAALGTYQRPTQPAQMPSRGGYPGAYPGVSAAAASESSADSDRRLTIGRGITMSGEIESCDYLLVEGTVEAALKGANFLEVAESGVFYGTVEINEANIAGRFEGDITVNGRLTISAGGVVTGSISYKEIEIQAGAVIDGKLTPMSSAQTQAAPAKKPSTAPKAAAKPSMQQKRPEPANTDEGLFSKAAAAAE